MSIHPSLRGVNTLIGERSVLKRTERIAQLQRDGKFDEANDSAFGLPKVRTKFKIATKKKKGKEEAAEEKGAEEKAE